MRNFSITRYTWNGFRDLITSVGNVVACSQSHALEVAIKTFGAAHYTALELPLVPYGFDNRAAVSVEPTGLYYWWHTTYVGKLCVYSPYHFDA
jgi:hypothetical protein